MNDEYNLNFIDSDYVSKIRRKNKKYAENENFFINVIICLIL